MKIVRIIMSKIQKINNFIKNKYKTLILVSLVLGVALFVYQCVPISNILFAILISFGDFILFVLSTTYNYILPAIIILLSISVIIFNNPIYSLLALIFVFFSMILFLISINIEFLAMIFLIIYIGAISILFLFVIMMFNLKNLDTHMFPSNFYFSICFYTLIIAPKFYFIVCNLIQDYIKREDLSNGEINDQVLNEFQELGDAIEEFAYWKNMLREVDSISECNPASGCDPISECNPASGCETDVNKVILNNEKSYFPMFADSPETLRKVHQYMFGVNPQNSKGTDIRKHMYETFMDDYIKIFNFNKKLYECALGSNIDVIPFPVSQQIKSQAFEEAYLNMAASNREKSGILKVFIKEDFLDVVNSMHKYESFMDSVFLKMVHWIRRYENYKDDYLSMAVEWNKMLFEEAWANSRTLPVTSDGRPLTPKRISQLMEEWSLQLRDPKIDPKPDFPDLGLKRCWTFIKRIDDARVESEIDFMGRYKMKFDWEEDFDYPTSVAVPQEWEFKDLDLSDPNFWERYTDYMNKIAYLYSLANQESIAEGIPSNNPHLDYEVIPTPKHILENGSMYEAFMDDYIKIFNFNKKLYECALGPNIDVSPFPVSQEIKAQAFKEAYLNMANSNKEEAGLLKVFIKEDFLDVVNWTTKYEPFMDGDFLKMVNWIREYETFKESYLENSVIFNNMINGDERTECWDNWLRMLHEETMKYVSNKDAPLFDISDLGQCICGPKKIDVRIQDESEFMESYNIIINFVKHVDFVKSALKPNEYLATTVAGQEIPFDFKKGIFNSNADVLQFFRESGKKSDIKELGSQINGNIEDENVWFQLFSLIDNDETILTFTQTFWQLLESMSNDNTTINNVTDVNPNFFVTFQHQDIFIFSYSLYTDYSPLFILLGFVLLTAMIGAIVLALTTTPKNESTSGKKKRSSGN